MAVAAVNSELPECGSGVPLREAVTKKKTLFNHFRMSEKPNNTEKEIHIIRDGGDRGIYRNADGDFSSVL